MNESKASQTALATSFMRAIHTRLDDPKHIDDPWGDRLLLDTERATFGSETRLRRPRNLWDRHFARATHRRGARGGRGAWRPAAPALGRSIGIVIDGAGTDATFRTLTFELTFMGLALLALWRNAKD